MAGDEWYGYPCYEFNETLDRTQDDWRCVHCRKFLTLQCPHIDEFLEEEEEIEEET
jgi:hypothetical protein